MNRTSVTQSFNVHVKGSEEFLNVHFASEIFNVLQSFGSVRSYIGHHQNFHEPILSRSVIVRDFLTAISRPNKVRPVTGCWCHLRQLTDCPIISPVLLCDWSSRSNLASATSLGPKEEKRWRNIWHPLRSPSLSFALSLSPWWLNRPFGLWFKIKFQFKLHKYFFRAHRYTFRSFTQFRPRCSVGVFDIKTSLLWW